MRTYLADLKRDWIRVLLEVYVSLAVPVVFDAALNMEAVHLGENILFALGYPLFFVFMFCIGGLGVFATWVVVAFLSAALVFVGLIGWRRFRMARLLGCLGLGTVGYVFFAGMMSV